MSELYYQTTPEECIVPEQYMVGESQNIMGNVAGAIGYICQCVGFIILLGVSGIGMLLLGMLVVADEMEC